MNSIRGAAIGDQAHATVEQVQMLRAAFAEKHCPRVVPMIEQYVADRALITLRTAAEEGVPAAAEGVLFREQVLIAILPLLDKVVIDRHPDAAGTMQAWINAMRVGQAELQAMLPRSTNYQEVDRLIQAGADPNGPAPLKPQRNKQMTALECARRDGRDVSVKRMLDHLAVRKSIPFSFTAVAIDAEPTHFFAKLLEAESSEAFSHSCRVLDHLHAIDLPSKWHEQIGELVSDYARRGKLQQTAVAERTELRMLALARMTSPQGWLDILTNPGIRDGSLAESLLSTRDDAGIGKRVVARMLEDGLHPDQIPARILEDVSYPATLLQAAIYEDKADIAIMLIQAGADPDRALAAGDGKYAGADSFDIARLRHRTETHTVLMALNARRSIQAILRGARHSNAATP
jgi:hypothetical protein